MGSLPAIQFSPRSSPLPGQLLSSKGCGRSKICRLIGSLASRKSQQLLPWWCHVTCTDWSSCGFALFDADRVLRRWVKDKVADAGSVRQDRVGDSYVPVTGDYYTFKHFINLLYRNPQRFGHFIPLPGPFHFGLSAQEALFFLSRKSLRLRLSAKSLPDCASSDGGEVHSESDLLRMALRST